MKEETKKLINYYENLSIDSLDSICNFYHENCYFKDPFHEFESRQKLQDLYSKMFAKLTNPRFIITNSFEKDDELVLFWEFKCNETFSITGSTLLIYDNDKKIIKHIDYWDSVREFWVKIPVIKWFFKLIYRFLQ